MTGAEAPSSARQAAAWRAELGASAPVMGVNLSARQFQQPGLLTDIRRALRAARLDPSALKLEITESVLMADAQSTVETLQSLKAVSAARVTSLRAPAP